MNIIVLYIGEKIASTVYDHLYSFKNYSRYNIFYIDILKDEINLEILDKFDVIVIHYTISIFSDNRCPSWMRVLLRNTSAKKVIFIQDEYNLKSLKEKINGCKI